MTTKIMNFQLLLNAGRRQRPRNTHGGLAAIFGGETPGALQPHPKWRMTQAEFPLSVGEMTRTQRLDGAVIVMLPVTARHDEILGWFDPIPRLFVERYELPEVVDVVCTTGSK